MSYMPWIVHLTGLGVAIVFLFLFIAVLVALWILNRPGRPPLPPGPPAERFLGHYRLVPTDAAFRQYAEWSKEYGSDVLFFHTFGTKWIVLHSFSSATELLERRGSLYADRPRFVMFEEMGWAPTLTWLRWGPRYNLHRRTLQPLFTKSRVSQYQNLQRKEALRCCKGMLDDPINWLTAVRRFSVAIVLKIAYGLDVDGPQSPWIKLAEDSSEAVGKSGAPASSIMDRFPAARYLPSWLPFMERLRYARTWRPAIEAITRLPFDAAIKLMNAEKAEESFVQSRMKIWFENSRQGCPNRFSLEDIKGAAATILIAGNDTTAATVMLLVLYLMQNQEVQRKAQEEIERIVGKHRLPSWNDIPKLRYTNLVLQETYRINPLSPLGIPHASIADDVYNGMFIPKGTIVYPNVWAMMHDPKVYSDPFRFWPDRYLPKEEGGNGEPLPIGHFGFGRRICIGKYLAENSLLIILATMLATMNIDWPLGPDGQPTPFEPEWSFRGQAIVLPFGISITSRSEKAMAALNEEIDALQT